jgi:putative ABC transport system permease protein
MTSMLHAWRALLRRPSFSITTVVIMAAGIGVTTALFSVVDRVLISPLPFPAAGQLVSVYEASAARRERTSLIAPVRLEDWNRLNRTFEVISGSYAENVTDTSGAEPERLECRRVMARYFDVFRMTPLVGRPFTAEEDRFGGPTAAVISEALWTRRFGRANDVVTRSLTVGGRGYTIVGVMPQAFTTASTDVWIPAQLSPGLMRVREARFVGGVGRMKGGVSLDEARSDMTRVQRMLGEQFPKTDKDWSVEILDLKEVRVGGYRRALLMLFGAVAVLFVIAVANVAGLMLVQLRRRTAEFAIRSAIGASPTQVVSVVMREVAILAGLGAAAGAGCAIFVTRLLAVVFVTVPRMTEVAVDRRALAFVVIASVAAAASFGLVPAMLASRRRVAPLLSAGGRGISAGQHDLQRALVVAQVALSVLLAGAAGLLVRSYGALTQVDVGFNPHNVLMFHVGATWDEDRGRVGQMQERILSELQQLPGVHAAGFTNFLPATGATLRYQVHIEGLAGPENNGTLTVGTRTVTPGYLRALEVPLLAGEWCSELRSADANTPMTAMVNRRFVDLYGGGQSLVGRNLDMRMGGRLFRVTGILGDIREDGQGAPTAPYAYICATTGSWPDPEYAIRLDGDSRTALTAIRQLVHRIDPTRPIFAVKRLDDVMSAAVDQPRLNAQVLSLFAATALALAALGLHGLMTLLVTERRHELGVRMALGAAPADLARLVMVGAGRLVAAGMLGGLLLTLGASRAFGAVLFAVSPHDPRALATALLALVLVSAISTAFPLRQAAAVSATEAMRGD